MNDTTCERNRQMIQRAELFSLESVNENATYFQSLSAWGFALSTGKPSVLLFCGTSRYGFRQEFWTNVLQSLPFDDFKQYEGYINELRNERPSPPVIPRAAVDQHGFAQPLLDADSLARARRGWYAAAHNRGTGKAWEKVPRIYVCNLKFTNWCPSHKSNRRIMTLKNHMSKSIPKFHVH